MENREKTMGGIMSAYLEKERLLEWLENYNTREFKRIVDFGAQGISGHIIHEIKSGRFDWQPND